jgi:hypothetical protein
MVEELLLIHHTHTDIGYTHPQPVIFDLHHRFIDIALDLADLGREDREDCRFRWTCEVTGTTRAWWDQASNLDRDRFLSAISRGQFEVAGLEWHLTPLADARMLMRSLRNVDFFRELGVPIRSAMNTDVNGVPWGLVDILLDHGIDGFSMSINSHLGGPAMPRPGAFDWMSPDGRRLTVWNGFQYWHTANVLMRMPSSCDAAAEALPSILKMVEERGYPFSFLPLQITNPHHPDNATPDASLSAFVKEWNDREPKVRIRTVLLSDVFERLRSLELSTMQGDWTDYWNLGAGSSSRETAVFMEGLRVLDAAHSSRTWPGFDGPRAESNLDAAHESLALYAEHTWGADCSISDPESTETRMQWATKSAYAFQGLANARIVLRDGLHSLAKRAGGQEPTLLLYNPLSVPVHTRMRLPFDNLDWPLTPGVHHRLRLDGALGSLPEEATTWCLVDVPAFGYRTYAVRDLPRAKQGEFSCNDTALSSSAVRLGFKAEGGLQSFQVDGVEYCGTDEEFTFGRPIIEQITSRRDLMKLDFSKFEPAEGWNPNYERSVSQGVLLSTASQCSDCEASTTQQFEMANGDLVGVTYRVFADEPTVDVAVKATHKGDSKPYSLMLPFTLPERSDPQWHFDTAGAIVQFDAEQLPGTARHYVTTRRFVRMQTAEAALTIATPDLPLWKFGQMSVLHTTDLDPSDRRAVMFGWLANNYWEVNFLANQTGETQYRMQLIPSAPCPVQESYKRSLPFSVPPRLHAYGELGPSNHDSETLLSIDSDDVLIECISECDGAVLLTLQNIGTTAQTVALHSGALDWAKTFHSSLDGSKIVEVDRSCIDVPPRALTAVRLENPAVST